MSGQTYPAPGKVSTQVFERVIAPHLGAGRPDVIVGPRMGVDAGVVSVALGQVMAVTCDPLFVVPQYGWQRAAWFAVHIVASDAATSGIPPAFATFDLNLPLDMCDADLEGLWMSIHHACADLGVAVVTGHSGRYEGCAFPMLGACTMMSPGPEADLVRPDLIAPNDVVVVTKGPAIETTGQLGVVCGRHIEEQLGSRIAAEAADLFYQMSVVRDASIATRIGVGDAGLTSMHDATERGVQGALVELAEVSGLGIRVHADRMPVQPAVAAVCRLFDMDLLPASSEGTLVLTCRPHQLQNLLHEFAVSGIPAAGIGEMLRPGDERAIVTDGHEDKLCMPDADPFWPVLSQALGDMNAQ